MKKHFSCEIDFSPPRNSYLQALCDTMNNDTSVASVVRGVKVLTTMVMRNEDDVPALALFKIPEI